MGSVAVKINFLTHSMAQGKKQEPLTRDGVPGPSSNIQEAVIQGFTTRGKDVVRPRLGPHYMLFTFYKSMFGGSLQLYSNYRCVWNTEDKPVSQAGMETLCFHSQIYDLRVTIDDGYLNSETTYGQMEMIHKELQKYFMESMLPQ